MGRTYTASVVGAGSGGKLSLQALDASNRFELVAVADISETARKTVVECYPDVRAFADHKTMFAQCPTDVVCVSTWPPSHLSVTRDALALPLKGILVEKPLSDNVEDGTVLLDLIKKKNLPVAVPHGLLVAAHVHRILNHVKNGEIGDLKLVEIQCNKWDIINAGIHWLNFVVKLVEEPFVQVLAACDKSTRTYRDGVQVETLAVTSAQTKSGVRVVMHTGDRVHVNCESGGTVFRLLGTQGDIEFYAWTSRYRMRNAKYPTGELFDVPQLLGTAHQRHLERLAEQMDCEGIDYEIADSSLAALELCEAAYISARYGCAVTLPLADFVKPVENDWQPGKPYCGTGGGRDGRKL
jgi:predicted dehydrogenase